MKIRLLLLLATLGLALVAVPPAQAATTNWAYAASTGATYVHLADNTITSDFTASSDVSGAYNNTTSSNSTAATQVGSLGSIGAAQTKTTGTYNSPRTTLHSHARTAGVSLLGGMIRADAVTTDITSYAKHDGTHGIVSANTQFVGLHISGIHVPVNIPKDWKATIPGVASISANYAHHAAKDGMAATLGWGLDVTLLQPRAGMPAGAVVVVNPVNQYFAKGSPGGGAQLSGGAYATHIEAHVGNSVGVLSSPLAYVATPWGSSHGTTLMNSTASAKLGKGLNTLLTADAVRSTSWSDENQKGDAEIRNMSEVAKLNLLGGLIKADAIKVTAHGKFKDGKWTGGLHMTTVNLVIAGKSIPIDIKPNTTLNVANLGKVQLNYRVRKPKRRMDAIYGIKITLSTARAGLDAGSVIELGVAATKID